MNKQNEGPGLEIFENLRKIIEETPDLDLVEIARDFGSDEVQEYLSDHETCAHLENDKNKLLVEVINAPQDFTGFLPSFDLTYEGFGYDQFFIKNKGCDTNKILKMYALQSTPDVARIGAVLLAENIRFNLLQDLNWCPDITTGVHADLREQKLSDEIRKASRRDSVIAIQNAMVDYIETQGSTLPLHRAAAMLPVLTQDVKQHMRDLWTKKITDFSVKKSYSIKLGDIVDIKPVYRHEI